MNRPEKEIRRPKFLCIIGCEGKNQERLYFNKVQEIVNSIGRRSYDLQFDYAEPFGGDPKCVVERTILKSIGKVNKAAVFDYDGKKKKYEEAIDLATDGGIILGYTNYCFDLWLLLHKEDYFNVVSSQDDYAQELRSVYGLDKEANIKKARQMERILKQISVTDIKAAILRAERMASDNLQKAVNKTSQGRDYYDNPDTQVHNLLKWLFVQVGVGDDLEEQEDD